METKTKMTRKVNRVTLGHTYEDVVHGLKGVATCYATHLTGCDRISLEWVDKDGALKEVWVDEHRLLDSDGNPVVPASEVAPGPGADPARRGIK